MALLLGSLLIASTNITITGITGRGRYSNILSVTRHNTVQGRWCIIVSQIYHMTKNVTWICDVNMRFEWFVMKISSLKISYWDKYIETSKYKYKYWSTSTKYPISGKLSAGVHSCKNLASLWHWPNNKWTTSNELWSSHCVLANYVAAVTTVVQACGMEGESRSRRSLEWLADDWLTSNQCA